MYHNLRLAAEKDEDFVLGMIVQGFKKSPYRSIGFSEDKCREFFLNYIFSDKSKSVIIISDDPIGIIIGVIHEPVFSSEHIALEICLWGETPKLVHSLIKAYEFWAKKMGVTLITFGLHKDYSESKLGYFLGEQSYFLENN